MSQSEMNKNIAPHLLEAKRNIERDGGASYMSKGN
jgi:hypothetical protein